MTKVRGVRGAITVRDNSEEEILVATGEMLRKLAEDNGLNPEEIAGAIFTVSQDLNAAFPAKAARQMGWDLVPLMCATEIAVPGSMCGVVRVMVLWNTTKSQAEIKHVYLRDAVKLRPDLSQGEK
ncbi:chorismate mutase [Clostridiales bacterium PH28_bin88]|nr:chorismate mutase [Clostridiales bacterium PH28_bin88]